MVETGREKKWSADAGALHTRAIVDSSHPAVAHMRMFVSYCR